MCKRKGDDLAAPSDKHLRLDLTVFRVYRRPGSNAIFLRDRQGRYRCFLVNAVTGEVRLTGGGISTLPPCFGRVAFGNNVRFVAHTRSQDTLDTIYINAPALRILSTGWVDLPLSRQTTRRTANQGMNVTMIALTTLARSATQYVTWYSTTVGAWAVNVHTQWEWCHLLAHSLGGLDNATNVVAAVRGNNTEQLAIESALQMYRLENCFEMQISAVLLDGGNGCHIATVIRYEIRLNGYGSYVRYLDCLNAPNPSQIHFYGLLEEIVSWANAALVWRANQNNISVTPTEQRLIKRYMQDK
jgi:hypothetical protein